MQPESSSTLAVKIDSECQQLVLSQGLAGGLATTGVAALLLLVIRDVHPIAHLIGWAVAVIAVVTLRILLTLWQKRPDHPTRNLPHTRWLSVLVGLLSGGLWGAASTLLFPLNHSELYFVTAFLLIGMPAGAISSFGAWWPAYASYVLASVGPFALYFFWLGGGEFMLGGVAACIFGAFLLREGRVIERTIKSNIAHRIELQGLSHSLAEALDNADASNRAKSAFLANISHELRTPLASIISMSELLAEDPDSPHHKNYPATICRAGESLLTLINDVIDLSRIEAGKLDIHPVPFAPPELVAEIGKMFESSAASKSLSLTIAVAEDVPKRFVGDAARLRQVVVNLLSNAVKFTAVGGIKITLESPHDAAGRRRLRLTVSDSGIGIPEIEQQRVFSAFHQADNSLTRSYDGSGLGLAICRDLVALMSGELTLASQPGAGSSFTLTIPELTMADEAVPSHETGDGRVVVPDADALRGMRILVVEDNALNATLICVMLERSGCEAGAADSGDIALLRMRNERWDAVLMDCQMPGTDGYSATRQWRDYEAEQGRARLPIIALTAHAMAADREKCLQAGMDDYFSKPVDFKALRAVLAQHAPMRRDPTSDT